MYWHLAIKLYCIVLLSAKQPVYSANLFQKLCGTVTKTVSEKQLLRKNSAARQLIHPAVRAQLHLPALDRCPELACSSGARFYSREWGYVDTSWSELPWISSPESDTSQLEWYAFLFTRVSRYHSDQCFQNEHVLLFEFLRLITEYRRNIKKTITHILHTSPCPTGAPSRPRKNSLKLSASSAMSLKPAFLPADRISISAPSDLEIIPAPSANQSEIVRCFLPPVRRWQEIIQKSTRANLRVANGHRKHTRYCRFGACATHISRSFGKLRKMEIKCLRFWCE